MAAEEDPPNLESTQLLQHRRGNKGQYLYWMIMPHPRLETVAAHELKVPQEFTRQESIDLGVEVHTACGVQLEECACFREPHEDGQPHLNLLGRATVQCQLPGTV